jgi:hypothetical protein
MILLDQRWSVQAPNDHPIHCGKFMKILFTNQAVHFGMAFRVLKISQLVEIFQEHGN